MILPPRLAPLDRPHVGVALLVLDADAELVFLQEPQLLQLAGNQLQGVERAVRKLAKALGVDPAELISAE